MGFGPVYDEIGAVEVAEPEFDDPVAVVGDAELLDGPEVALALTLDGKLEEPVAPVLGPVMPDAPLAS